MRVCDVVREHLGLGMLRARFKLPAKDTGDKTLAQCLIFNTGWKCEMIFYPMFFEITLGQQLEVVVHEHLHLLMHPFEQAIGRFQQTLSNQRQDQLEETLIVAREITVDHATLPILNLLRPHILKVL